MFESIFDVAFNSPIKDIMDWLVSPEAAVYVANTPFRIFSKLTDWFMALLNYSKPMWAGFGEYAIGTFTITLNDQFFTTVIGFIFGFFIFKFCLSKTLDLIKIVI